MTYHWLWGKLVSSCLDGTGLRLRHLTYRKLLINNLARRNTYMNLSAPCQPLHQGISVDRLSQEKRLEDHRRRRIRLSSLPIHCQLRSFDGLPCAVNIV
jgi:hypothetical protein